jgi:type IV pilus modification protein PilV
MVTTMTREKTTPSAQRGFTLIEVMIAIAILSIGILTLIAAFGAAIASTRSAQQDLIARQKALEAMESIYTARNTQQIVFTQIANIGSGGIFTDGATAMLSAGPDGLVNTADDINFAASGVCPAGPECIPVPGPDGILGTADDLPMSLANFTRQIQINTVLDANGNLDTNLKQVVVTVTYTRIGTTVPRTYTVNGLISAYR